MKEAELNSLKEHIKTTGNNIFATFKVETISNLIIYYEELEKEHKAWNLKWSVLKQAFIDKYNVTQDTIYLDILTDILQPIEKVIK